MMGYGTQDNVIVQIDNKELGDKIKELRQPKLELEIIAHRGFSHLTPENTLMAMDTAIAYGADSLEFDVQISSDGVPVVIHDPTVDRTTSGAGNVKDQTLAQLQALDAGTKYSSKFAGVRIPTLQDVLKLAKSKSKYVYPEIKGYRTTADISLMVNKVIEQGFERQCVMQSFNHDTDFPFVRAISSKITLGYLVSTEAEFNTALSKAVSDGNAVILASYSVITTNPTLATNARAQGVDVAVWTVDDSYLVQTLVDAGITRFMSNRLRGKLL